MEYKNQKNILFYNYFIIIHINNIIHEKVSI